MAASSLRSRTPSAFPLFSTLPKELRLQIYSCELPESRILYLQRHTLALYQATRVSSASAIDTPLSFFDIDGTNQPFGGEELEVGIHYGPTEERFAFRSQSRIPVLLLICKETHELLTTGNGFHGCFYEQIVVGNGMGECAQTWIDWKRDIPYFDWGIGYEPGGVPYLPTDLSSTICQNIKTLAVHDTISAYRRQGFRSYEDWIFNLLSCFPAMEKLILIAKHHLSIESEDLVLMEEERLKLWSNGLVWGKGETLDARDVREMGERGKMPKIDCKTITTREMRDRLLQICEGEGLHIEELGDLDAFQWSLEIRSHSKLSVTQQRKYLEFVVESIMRYEELDDERIGTIEKAENLIKNLKRKEVEPDWKTESEVEDENWMRINWVDRRRSVSDDERSDTEAF